mgnify:CR=1 FL=1
MSFHTNTLSYPVCDIFSLAQTFECGQCFRWEALGEEHYRGVAFGKSLELAYKDGILYLDCGMDEFEQIWKHYFDLERDYAAIRKSVSIDKQTEACVRYGAGIRILHQDPWETLCSFILSQCNNIPRIRLIVSRLCKNFGEQIEPGIYSFPSAQKLAQLDIGELECLRCGYRAPYLLAAARAVVNGELDFTKLPALGLEEARSALTLLPGVGSKVADCMLLYGLHRLDAFPVDTWMKKAIAALYGAGFDPASAFGPYAGVAQQYIFYHSRQTKRK